MIKSEVKEKGKVTNSQKVRGKKVNRLPADLSKYKLDFTAEELLIEGSDSEGKGERSGAQSSFIDALK